MDPAALARAQQQQHQFLGTHFNAGPSPILSMPRQQGFPMQQQVPYDAYGYGMNPAAYPQIDPRFAPQYANMMPGMGMPGMPADMGTVKEEYPDCVN